VRLASFVKSRCLQPERERAFLLLCAVFILGSLPIASVDADEIDYGEYIRYLSTYRANSNRPDAVVAVGSYAYVAAEYELQILDISAPWNPELVGSVSLTWPANDLDVSGDYAFVAAGSGGGLRVIDVSDPELPVSVASLQTPGSCYAVEVVGSVAYVADGYGGGLQIISVLDPLAPFVLGGVQTPGYCEALVVVGGYAYIADGSTGGLQIVDVSDPEVPEIVGSAQSPGAARDVDVAGTFAYLADGEVGGLQVFDVSDPTEPEIVGSVQTLQDALAVDVSGTHALIADYDAGLQVVDITNPASPTLAGGLHLPGICRGVASAAGLAYVCSSFGLHVVDIDPIDSPPLIGELELPGYAADVAPFGSYALVIDGADDVFYVVDLADPSAPAISGSVALAGTPRALAADASHAYIAQSYPAELVVVDLASPETPSIAGTLTLVEDAEDIVAMGGHVYLPCGYQLLVVDVTDPSVPFIAQEVEVDYAHGVALSGSFAYVASGHFESGSGSLEIVDISVPETAHIIGSHVVSNYVESVIVNENQAFLGVSYSASEPFRVLAIDVSDPMAPQESDCIVVPGTEGLATDGHHVYCAGTALTIIDPVIPTNLSMVGTAAHSSARNTATDESFLYSADVSGLLILPLQSVEASDIHALPRYVQAPRISVSPTFGRELISIRLESPMSEVVRVLVCNTEGRIVRVLHEGRLAAGKTQLSWDGRDTARRPLPAGCYFVQARGSRGGDRQRIMLVR